MSEPAAVNVVCITDNMPEGSDASSATGFPAPSSNRTDAIRFLALPLVTEESTCSCARGTAKNARFPTILSTDRYAQTVAGEVELSHTTQRLPPSGLMAPLPRESTTCAKLFPPPVFPLTE